MSAYEELLDDAMKGNSIHFARQDYVEESWRIVDPVLDDVTPVHQYEPGSWGPVEADAIGPRGAGTTLRPNSSPGWIDYDAALFAASSWLLVAPQMPLMLPPAPMNNAAEASATNAIKSVYSIRSCPCSSARKFRRCFMT